MPKTYGSIDEEKGDTLPLVKVDLDLFDPKNPFGEDFSNPTFWKEVKDEYNGGKNGLIRSKAQRKVRLQYLQRSIGKNEDLLVHILTAIHDKYKKYCDENNFETYATFLFEVNEFAALILEEDFKKDPYERRYEGLLEMGEGPMKTILHLAAERDLYLVADGIISLYPSIVYVTTHVGDYDEYPLCFALQKFHDKTASLLIRAMQNSRVRCLFEDSDLDEARFYFKDYINHGNMKETVLAILDTLMNPDWPFIPVNKADKEAEESEWSDIPNVPIRYHFYYRMLDGDDNGRQAKKNNIVNEDFNHRSKSCLQLIAESSSKEEAIQHPVIRLLVRRKWTAYGQKYMMVHFFLYLIFLVLFSLALFLHTSTKKPLKYEGPLAILRMFCEIGTLLFTTVYIISEFDQVEKERWSYFKDPYNYFDISGLGAILLIIPLRFAEIPRAEWSISSVAFLINFLRVFKYFPAFKTLGLYSKTFAKIIYYDISKFAIVFLVTMFAFTGSVYMALKATDELNEVGVFWSVLLKEIRALTESQAFSDDYSKFKYEEALSNAIIQYDIDKTKLVTRIENSRFKFWNARIQNYIDGDFVSEGDIERELIDDWVTMKQRDSLKDKNIQTIKLMLNSKVKRTQKKE